MSAPYLPIIILAAGASSRMGGQDKLLEAVDGAPLIRQQARKALSVTAGPVIMALPPAPHPRYDALQGLEVLLCPVAEAAEGMNASLRTAMQHVPRDAGAVMVLLSDLPELTATDLERIITAWQAHPDHRIWRGETETGAPGHPIIFHADLFAALTDLKGDDGARSIVARHRDRVFAVPLPGQRARRDLDTPEDWKAWRQENPER